MSCCQQQSSERIEIMRILLQHEFTCIGSGHKLSPGEKCPEHLLDLVFPEIFVIIRRPAECAVIHLLIAIDYKISAAGRTLMFLNVAHFLVPYSNPLFKKVRLKDIPSNGLIIS